jgi:hypothetical protein
MNKAAAVLCRYLVRITGEGYDKKKTGMVPLPDAKTFMTTLGAILGFSNVVQNSILQRQYPPAILI